MITLFQILEICKNKFFVAPRDERKNRKMGFKDKFLFKNLCHTLSASLCYIPKVVEQKFLGLTGAIYLRWFYIHIHFTIPQNY